MKPILLRLLPLCLALGAGSALAQFVSGNEAVQRATNAAARVLTPPLPRTGLSPTPCAANNNCHAGPWLMVETAAGLMECTEIYARPTTCRPSTYGVIRLSRVWVVRSGGEWLECQYPTLQSRCVKAFAPPPANLPYSAVQ